MEVFSSIPHSSINNANRQYMVESGIKDKKYFAKANHKCAPNV